MPTVEETMSTTLRAIVDRHNADEVDQLLSEAERAKSDREKGLILVRLAWILLGIGMRHLGHHKAPSPAPQIFRIPEVALPQQPLNRRYLGLKGRQQTKGISRDSRGDPSADE